MGETQPVVTSEAFTAVLITYVVLVATVLSYLNWVYKQELRLAQQMNTEEPSSRPGKRKLHPT